MVSNFYTTASGRNFYDLEGTSLGVPDATEASLQSVVDTALAILATGMAVNIFLPDAGTTGIPVSTALPLCTGLRYYGVMPTFDHSGDVPDNDVTFTGGTWFDVANGVKCFQAQDYNGNALDAALGSPADNFSSTAVKECGIFNVGIDGGSIGISFGNTNQMGAVYSEFHNIVVKGTSSWGVNAGNFQWCSFERIWTFGCVKGQQYYADVDLNVLQPGNSYFTQVYDQPGNDLTAVQLRKHKGLVFYATSGSNLNEIFGQRMQANFFSKSSTTYTTATGGSGSFTLQAGKGAEMEVGMPVKFTHAGGNGNITTGITYFIKTVSTDTVSVSATRGGAAISGSFSTSTAFTTYGYGQFEVYSDGSSASSKVTNSYFGHLDLEGVAQGALYMENCQGCVVMINELKANPGGEQHIVLRGNTVNQPNYFTVTNSFTTDVDGASVQCQFFGSRDISDSKQNTGQWLGRNATSARFTLGLGSADVSVRAGNFEQKEPSGGQFVYCLSGLGQRVHGNYGAADTTTLNAGQAGYVYCTTSGAGAITWNLPTISDAVVGLTFKVRNNRAGGAGATLTLTAATGQPINNVSGKLSVELAAPSGSTIAGVYLVACSDGSSGFFWDAVLEAGATIP